MAKRLTRFERCKRDVEKKIKQGKIKKTFMRKGKRIKTNAFAICEGIR